MTLKAPSMNLNIIKDFWKMIKIEDISGIQDFTTKTEKKTTRFVKST